MEFEWNIFPGFTTLQLVDEVEKFMSKMDEPEQFQGRIIFMSMFNDIKWGTTDSEQECIANARLVSLFAKRCPAGRWSFLGPGSENKWYSTNKERHSEKADTQFSEPRVRCLEERSKAKVENYRYTSVPMGKRLKLLFAQLFLLISSVSTD